MPADLDLPSAPGAGAGPAMDLRASPALSFAHGILKEDNRIITTTIISIVVVVH